MSRLPIRFELTLTAPDVPSGTSYFPVSAHIDDIESPTGIATPGAEVDRSLSTCC